MKLNLAELTGFPHPRNWNAQWIWPDNGMDPAKANTFVLFRKTFSMGDPGGAKIFITADTRYQLFVNGKFVERGQPLSQPFFQYYDEHDLSGVVRAGENCIGVIVYHLGINPYARGGLLAEIVDGKGKSVVGTDASWRGQVAAAWNANTFRYQMNVNAPFQEQFDARKFPREFASVGFDDSRWSDCAVVKTFGNTQPPAVGPWTHILPRDIPPMAERAVVAKEITLVGESLGLQNRPRMDDLTITLSQPVTALKYAAVEGAENLLREKGAATVVRCSTKHLEDVAFDGIYEPSIVLDFGRIITAHVELDVEGAAGSTVDIGYAERLVDGHFINAIEGIFADRVILREGRQTYSPFHWRAFRYLKLRFTGAFSPLKIHALRTNVTTYPYEERGGFQSSDETLNRVFDISQHTLRLCSHEAFFDTPWRETAQWLGDVAAVTIPAVYACFGDTTLAGKYFRQSAMNQYPTGLIANITNGTKSISSLHSVIPDYSLWWMMGLWKHYMYTGETRWIDSFYPHALRVLQANLPHLNERGLVEHMPGWVFIDWADLERKGESAAYNAIFYGALGSLLSMAEMKGDRHTVGQIRQIRAALESNYVAAFFNPAAGMLADARVGGTLSPKSSEQTNFAAIFFGLVTPELANGIADKVLANSRGRGGVTEAQPQFMPMVLESLQRLGRMDVALKLMRERWGRMLAQGATSTFEEWTINGSRRYGPFEPFMRSCSHAWSACPAEFLIRNLMGLEIVAPGCAKIRLAPVVTGFDYEVAYATPRGTVRVACKGGKLERVVPAGMEVVA